MSIFRRNFEAEAVARVRGERPLGSPAPIPERGIEGEVRVIVVPAHKRFLEAVKPFALDIRTAGSDWEIVPRCQADQETILRHLKLSGIHGVLRRVRPEVVIG